jgi:hypothetical protein
MCDMFIDVRKYCKSNHPKNNELWKINLFVENENIVQDPNIYIYQLNNKQLLNFQLFCITFIFLWV